MRRLTPKQLLVGGIASATLIALLLSLIAGRVLERVMTLPPDAEFSDIASLLSGDIKEDSPARESRSSRSRRRSKGNYVDGIVKRSIFDSTKVGLEAEAGDIDTDDCRRTDLSVVLLATIVASPESFSSALIGEERSKTYPTGYGIGDNVQGKEIVAIEQKKVVLKSGSDVECLMVAGEESRTRPSGSGEEVTTEGDTTYVDEDMLEEALKDPTKLATQIRAVPHKGKDGEIDGYRLSGIRRGSFFDKLGVKNGDIIHAVNGQELTSVSKAMDAYGSLQSERSFEFDITRRNKRQTQGFEVR